MDHNIPSAPSLELNESMLIRSLILLNKKLYKADTGSCRKITRNH